MPCFGAKKVWQNTAIAASLFLLIWLAYRPSLGHVPRADQWCVFLDTLHQDGFLANLAHTYSYNRTRAVLPGDYQLFRPILFALLSAEKAVFGNHFALWQGTGIVLHFLVAYLLLQVLLQVLRLTVTDPRLAGQAFQREVGLESPTYGNFSPQGWFSERFLLQALAYGLALFFGLNFAVVEMVIWSHINGYILFVIFVLGSALLTLQALAEPVAPRSRQTLRLAGAFLLVLLGAFTYEAGQFYAVVVGLVLGGAAWQRGRRRRALALFVLFASVLPLYQGLNRLDRAAHALAWDNTHGRILQQTLTVQTLKHAGRYALYTGVQPFFPSRALVRIESRLEIPEPLLRWDNYVRWDPILLTSWIVVGAGLLLSVRGLCRVVASPGRIRLVLILLLLSTLFVLHAAVTVLGRMNLRPESHYISTNSYYAYMPLLSLISCLYLSWTWAVPGSSPRNSTGRQAAGLIPAVHTAGINPAARQGTDTISSGRNVVRFILFALLLGLVVLNVCSGLKVRAVNHQMKLASRTLRIAIDTVQRFVDRHRAEPGFSLAFDESVHDSLPAPNSVAPLMVLFPRFIDNHHPKYLFTQENNKLVVKRCDDPARVETSDTRQICPDLVEGGTTYNFFNYEGWYYGVPVWAGRFHPRREDHAYLIRDRTLEGVRRQVPRKVEEQRAAGGTGITAVPSVDR